MSFTTIVSLKYTSEHVRNGTLKDQVKYTMSWQVGQMKKSKKWGYKHNTLKWECTSKLFVLIKS